MYKCDILLPLLASTPNPPKNVSPGSGRGQGTSPGAHAAPIPGAESRFFRVLSRQEFVQLAQRLLSDPALEKELVANGKEYVRLCHSWKAERDVYRHLVGKLEGNSEE